VSDTKTGPFEAVIGLQSGILSPSESRTVLFGHVSVSDT
jgi:hypothetical protein